MSEQEAIEHPEELQGEDNDMSYETEDIVGQVDDTEDQFPEEDDAAELGLDKDEEYVEQAEEEPTSQNGNEETEEADRSQNIVDGEVDEEGADGANEDEIKGDAGEEEEEAEDEEEEEEEGGTRTPRPPLDPNVMPQVNVQVLANRKWQVKVYPLKPADFMSGTIWRVFKDAKESLLYLISAGKYSRGKGEMYISSVNMTLRVVQGLMKRDSTFNEINIEIVKKNDEGVVEEKAYMRFDTKMVRMLFTRPFSWNVHGMGRKRERLIGSVFVKNLPPSTSKDMLRVMFPFAQEINYNPEKFKEGTARLVMKSRNSVIPCLKAFAKIELGGQVLELHPLEKKRASRDDKSKSESHHRSRSTSVKSDEETEEKAEESTKEDKSDEPESKEEEAGSGDAKKESPTKKAETPKAKSSDQDKRKSTGGRPNQKKQPAKKSEDDGGANRSSRDKKDSDRPRKPFRGESRGGGSGYRGKSGDNFRSRRFEGSRGGGRGRSSRGGSSRGGRGGFGGSRQFSSGGGIKSDVMNTEATKDMLVLQNQLSMAIKSQLAVLNQTKMAVEQAKMGASGLGLGVGGAGSSGLLGSSGLSQMSDVSRYSPRGRMNRDRTSGGGYAGQKRKAPQAGLRQSDRGYNKRTNRGGKPFQNRSGGRGGGGARSAYSDYAKREDEYRRELYAREESAYASLGSSSYGAGGSGGSYQDYYSYGGY